MPSAIRDTLRALVLDSAYPARGESPWYGSLIRTGNHVARARLPPARRSVTATPSAASTSWSSFLRGSGRGVGGLLEAFGGATYGTPESYLAIDRAGVQLRHGNQHPWKRLTRHLQARLRLPASSTCAPASSSSAATTIR